VDHTSVLPYPPSFGRSSDCARYESDFKHTKTALAYTSEITIFLHFYLLTLPVVVSTITAGEIQEDYHDQAEIRPQAAGQPGLAPALPSAEAKSNTGDSTGLDRIQRRRGHLIGLLDAAIAPGRAVQALTEVGINSEDLSVALHANARTAASWLAGPPAEIRKKQHRERIWQLKEVTRFVVNTGTIAGQEADWLRDPNRSVDFRTPLELIREGDWKRAGRLYCEDIAVEVPPQFLDGPREPAKSSH
jgi:hypothetical protein